jgi:putative ABC transport system permease protein
MRALLQDFQYSFRVLLKSRGFAAAAILVLALGIGANTAIFSVVNAVLLRPLPFKDSERLVQVWHVPPQRSFPGMTRFPVSAANYVDWQNQNQVFEKMAIYSFSSLNLASGDQPEALQGAAVSPDFFSSLRSQPILGRTFVPEEDQPGHGHVVILSHALWKNHFAGNPSIVGQNVTFDGQAYAVVGVMDSKFRFPDWAQFWTPLAWTDQQRAVRGEHHYGVIGRLKPGVPLLQAQAEMNTISSRLEQQYPEDDKGWGAIVISLREQMVGEVRLALLVLLGAVVFVLLIACANVANLTLAKTFARRKEIAIRAALGASRGRVLQQVLAETVLLSLAGGLVGLLFANAGTTVITKFLPDSLPRSTEISLDVWVLAFALVVSLLTGIAAGLAPAFRLTKTDLNEALKQGLGRTDSDSGGGRIRSLLVVSEVALSIVLLIGAGLMIRSLWLLHSTNPGFDPANVITMTVVVPRTKYASPLQQVQFFDATLSRVRALPGVESAGVIDDLPLSGDGSHQPIAIEGRPVVPMSDQPEVDVRLISSGYLPALRVPLRRGRDLSASDTADRPAVVLISEAMAHRFWPNEDPLGKHLTLTFFPDKSREIVGIVGDVKHDSLDVAAPPATLYFPLSQVSPPSLGGWNSFPMFLVVRTTSHPTSLVSAVTTAIHEVDRQTPVVEVATMEDVIANSLSTRRFNMLLLASFAGLALLLAAVGVYSVLAYSVRCRVREIGIRMALGAEMADVLRLILFEGIRPVLIGVAVGLTGALALGRVVASLIYGVKPSDPATFFAVSALLAAVALLASVVPAYRATQVDPMKTLRDE